MDKIQIINVDDVNYLIDTLTEATTEEVLSIFDDSIWE